MNGFRIAVSLNEILARDFSHLNAIAKFHAIENDQQVEDDEIEIMIGSGRFVYFGLQLHKNFIIVNEYRQTVEEGFFSIDHGWFSSPEPAFAKLFELLSNYGKD